MSEPTAIETRLREAASHVSWPDDADLSPGVTRELATKASPRRRWPALRLAAMAAVLLLAVLAVPAGREAIADLLGIRGIDIRLSPVSPGPVPDGFDPGDRSSLAEAAEATGLPLLVPDELGPPDAVFVDPGPPVMVTASWEGDAGIPFARVAEMGVLHTQFEAAADEPLRKELGPRTSLQAVEVRGHDGWWIEGEPHRVEVGGDGSLGTWQVRLAGNVLMWEEGVITHRIETVGDLDEALSLAESLRPLSDDGSRRQR